MPWRWTPYVDTKVREAMARELVGGTVRLETSSGTPLAILPLTGKTETLVATATAKGRVVKVAVQNALGESLGSVPGAEVCDRTEVEPGARVTLTMRLG